MVVAVLVVFTVRVSLPPQSVARPADEYPFPVVSEFLITMADDRLVLEDVAARFLCDVGWSPATDSSWGWDFDGIDVLTLDGRQAGVYGLLLFEEPTDLAANLEFVLCGEILEPLQSEIGPNSAMGLYIAVLDGRAQPYHVLPVTAEEMLPRARDLRRAASGECPRPPFS